MAYTRSIKRKETAVTVIQKGQKLQEKPARKKHFYCPNSMTDHGGCRPHTKGHLVFAQNILLAG